MGIRRNNLKDTAVTEQRGNANPHAHRDEFTCFGIYEFVPCDVIHRQITVDVQ